MKDQGIRSDMWRWWCGGSVISVAVVLGCASAVEYKDSKSSSNHESAHAHAHGGLPSKKHRLGVAAEPGREPAHNGGKMTMPVSASFDGDSILTLSRDTNVVISISADDEIRSIQGLVEGGDGLQGSVRQMVDFTDLGAGETKAFVVRVPARTGSLILRISGEVRGTPMSKSIELKIVNPREAVKSMGTSSLRGTSGKPSAANGGMTDAVSSDSTGQIVQPMSATED